MYHSIIVNVYVVQAVSIHRGEWMQVTICYKKATIDGRCIKGIQALSGQDTSHKSVWILLISSNFVSLSDVPQMLC